MCEPKGERRERKGMSSSGRHPQQKQQTFFKQRKEDRYSFAVEGTEIKINQISAMLKKKKKRQGHLNLLHAGQMQLA